MNNDELNIQTLAETENYVAWLSDEPDGEQIVHLELGALTRHFFREEWGEFVQLVDGLRHAPKDDVLAETESFAILRSEDDLGVIEVELGPMTLYFAQDEWTEVLELVSQTRQALSRR